ncbi:glycoside hydrolase family 3 N-terminal domain-containing protein [Glaciibacter sp. 2TAF33]|uniref:glycoside hydrolase family 3 N-terminal domain-containing protein n=1 Tax=Glaciibacter sp. 2TAF33 TaxID=3233015 RepID=UPI003F93F6FD
MGFLSAVSPGRITGRWASTAGRLAGILALVPVLLVAGCSTGPASQAGRAPGHPSPTQTRPDPARAYVADTLASMTLEQRIGSMLMLHYPGTDPAPLRSLVDTYGLGGLIMMGDNVPADPGQLPAVTGALSADARLPLLVGIDQEGGTVSRLPSDTAPGAEQLRTLPPQATREAFGSRARLLAASGVNVNFGIVADVTADPGSFIFDRVLGTDAGSSAVRVAAAAAGERGQVLSTLKHFPGHGGAPGDSHHTVPVAGLDYQSWLNGPALPFQAGIAAGAELVMFGHLAYPAVDPLPASLSARWHEVLRGPLGFDGVTITDDMLMLQHTGLPQYADPAENAIRALAAGNTMLLYVLPADPAVENIDLPGLIGSIAQAVGSGRIPASVIDDDARRLLTLRHSLAAAP